MSEANQTFNPYAVDAMLEGGGLTRDIVVTSARYVTYGLTRKDGSPVIDERTKQQSIFIGLRVEAISIDPGREQKPYKYEWSAGRKAKPSADGEQLVQDDGSIAKFYKNSNLGRAIEGLRAGGFDPKQLFPRVSALVGAKLTLEGVNKIKADGSPKTHVFEGKIYNDIEWFPVKFNGWVDNVATKTGNSADLAAKAEAAVVTAIIEAGGSIERKDLIRALGTSLKGDADAIKVTTLVARQDFHTGRPWTFDGSRLTLGA
jgi:hypothetical protein